MTIKEETKNTVNEFKSDLPILSHYWEVTEAQDYEEWEMEYSLNVISSKHETSIYTVHTFYKPISTPIDLSYYDK